jgi:hypothetical protein
MAPPDLNKKLRILILPEILDLNPFYQETLILHCHQSESKNFCPVLLLGIAYWD